jgi:hypothetical protein
MVDTNATPRILLTPTERRKLTGYTNCDPRTVLRWERGEVVRPGSRGVLDAAARKFGMPVPERRT